MKRGLPGRTLCAGGVVWLLAFAGFSGLAWAQSPLKLKPGFNLFSRDKDISIGRGASAEIENQMPLVTDPQITRYVSDLGRELVRVAPGDTDYPWSFKVVNSQDINAFALPGGFIYINRGAIEAADNEAEIAGVMAHEIGHVVMRHGTNQASKALLAQGSLGILGGILGGEGASGGAQAAQLVLGLGVNSVLLRYSRTAETQSDQIGTYVLYHHRYTPRAMADFFEIIQKKYPQRTLEFFSDHPNPEKRIKKVNSLIPKLGPRRQPKPENPEFQAVKKKLLAMPPPPKAKPAPQPARGSAPPPLPSSRLVRYRGQEFSIGHPENWRAAENADGVTLAPEGGLLTGPRGESAQAYGAAVTRYAPPQREGWGLIDATEQLIRSLRQSNPNLRVVTQSSAKVCGRPALSTLLENDSPVEGQKETDHLITVRGRNVLIAVIFVAPQSAFGSYQPTFQAMLRSLDLP